jgi:hypothetical protein
LRVIPNLIGGLALLSLVLIQRAHLSAWVGYQLPDDCNEESRIKNGNDKHSKEKNLGSIGDVDGLDSIESAKRSQIHKLVELKLDGKGVGAKDEFNGKYNLPVYLILNLVRWVRHVGQ